MSIKEEFEEYMKKDQKLEMGRRIAEARRDVEDSWCKRVTSSSLGHLLKRLKLVEIFDTLCQEKDLSRREYLIFIIDKEYPSFFKSYYKRTEEFQVYTQLNNFLFEKYKSKIAKMITSWMTSPKED